MSTRDRLSRLTADLLTPQQKTERLEAKPLAPAGAATGPTEQPAEPVAVETRFPAVMPRPAGRRTGPGEMLAFRGQMLAAEGEVARLRDALQQFDGSLPTKKLDPQSVVPSRWANRHEASFGTPDFIRFKADVEHAGGNVQPILVRPTASDPVTYEIVFGHRRHRACLELGLPVLAAITSAPMSDLELFAAMDRENRERADLSAWEQGAMYRKALDEQMFPSQRRLAEALGLSHTWVRKAIAVAELPETVVQCFRSPLELQFKHAELITAALETDRKGVLRRAEKLRQSERVSASAVVAALIGKHRTAGEGPQEIRVGGTVAGRINWDARGQATIRLMPGVVHGDNVQALIEAISSVVAPSLGKA
jgi:ParB family chromosome partitioning protein